MLNALGILRNDWLAMTYDNWKASNPMDERIRENLRERDDSDWEIAADALADSVDALSTLAYAQGMTKHEKALAGDLFSSLLAGLLEHQPADLEPRARDNLRALNDSITSLVK